MTIAVAGGALFAALGLPAPWLTGSMVALSCDLFSELSVVFMDTTTLSFIGAGGATLGRRGHSMDQRPELLQMVLGVVIDGEGRPICTEMWPGNTADVSALLAMVDRLRPGSPSAGSAWSPIAA